MTALLIMGGSAGLIGEIVVYGIALVGAILHYLSTASRRGDKQSVGALIRHLFPRDLLLSRWTWLDVLYYFVNRATLALLVPTVSVGVVFFARAMQAVLQIHFGAAALISLNPASIAIFLLVGLLVRDFISFYVHYMQHRIPLLWELHKVHHAPETLIPPSGHRLHPLDQLLNLIAEAPLFGVIVGTFAWLTAQDHTNLVVCSVGFYVLVNAITCAPLRHSHIDLRLGWLERVFLSPAHHQLHHSAERRHWDRNFAAMFPIWDWMFGTLHAPSPSETYRLGLPDGTAARYSTLIGCYLSPLHGIHSGLRRHGLRHMLHVFPVATWPGELNKASHTTPPILKRVKLWIFRSNSL